MNELKEIMNKKLTENGDNAYLSTNDRLLDILFMSQYYRKNLDEVVIGSSDKEKLFAMFMRDPRYGLGERDLGVELLIQSEASPENICKSGRVDDLFLTNNYNHLVYFCELLKNGDYFAKKWSPRRERDFTKENGKIKGKNYELEAKVRKILKVSEKEYRQLRKIETTDSLLSTHRENEIEFSKVPSRAFTKYSNTFREKLTDKFEQFIEKVNTGEEKINVSVSTPYDLMLKYSRDRDSKLADVIFNSFSNENLGSILPIVDNSGSMYDDENSYLKARAVGHYVAKNSTYLNNHILSFSNHPKLIQLGEDYGTDFRIMDSYDDISRTNFGAVMDILSKLNKDFPEYLLVLSDMEFDSGSSSRKDETMRMFKEKGANTKIIWWNFNTRNKTCPETDEYGNIFMSGYSPQLLKFLESGFDGKAFLDKLLEEYKIKITETDKLI